MRLTAIRISNFRNLDGLDVRLEGAPVVVGENRSGKSNLVHAIRLVLDPSLSGRARTLSREDFSTHLGDDPMTLGAEITISLELQGFDDDPKVMAALRQAVVEGDPLRARLTYRFGPRELEEDEPALSTDAYSWSILGAEAEDGTRVRAELRSYLHLEYLDALRDVEGDLNSWRRSPLRRLLDRAAEQSTPEGLDAVRAAMLQASQAVDELEPVQQLAARIGEETGRLVGDLHAVEPTLRVGPADPMQAVRALRLLIDGAAERPLRTASLGSLNVLYLALLELELERRVAINEIGHALIAIEEPEAHLHPHLQRKAFRQLRASDGAVRSTLVTTHSAHIVSVCDPSRLLVLRGGAERSEAFSAAEADLETADWEDIGRYLDVTRAEMVFARKVLLVEGLAEQMLLPRLAEGLGMDLDALGVTVCAVAGVNFEPYARFLVALGTPYAVATDGDEQGPATRSGQQRMQRLAQVLTGSDDAAPADVGLFYGQNTLELDIAADEGNRSLMIETLGDFTTWGPQLEAEVQQAHASATISDDRLMRLIETVSKGRFAQRLATRADRLTAPPHVRAALEHLAAR